MPDHNPRVVLLLLSEGVRRDHSSPFRDQATIQLPRIGPQKGGVWPLFIPSHVNGFSGSSFEYVGHSIAAILSSLKGFPGYECVQQPPTRERSSCKIVYDLLDLPWLSDPPVTKGLRAPTQQGEDSFGLWHSSTKRPASDRNFNPKDKSSRSGYENSKGRPMLTCPPSGCASTRY